MASYAFAATPPSTAGRRDGKYWHMPHPLHQHQPLCMSPSPSPWVDAPPTPQDSQASACHSPCQSPRTLSAVLAENTSALAPGLEKQEKQETRNEAKCLDNVEEDSILISNGNAAMTASLQRSQPTLITIGPKLVGRESRETKESKESKENPHNKENKSKNSKELRMQQWLSEIPAPVTPQERYIQGLNPAVDHPLHPRPLRAHPVPSRQARYLSSTELSIEDDSLSAECEKLTIAGSDKENAIVRNRLQSLDAGENNKPKPAAAMASKKRQVSEDSMAAVGARKRTKLLDPVRRFSQRLSSSLALSGDPDYERCDSGNSGNRGNSDDLSPEDLARQSEQLYKFSKLRRVSTGQSRLSFSRSGHGSLRSQGTNTLRRIMSSKMTLPMTMTMPERDGSVEFWSKGRPDMIVNVAFIGDARVGKTALIKRLVHGTFPQTYAPSDLHEQTMRLVVDGTRVQLNLSEGGSGRDPRQPSILALGWYSIVVLCYDISQQASLQSLQKYRNEIAMYEENATVIMAGLKKDARHRLPPLQLSFVEEPVQVEREMANDVAMKLGCANYFECSSLSSCEGVDDLFDYVVQSGVDLQRARNKTMARFRFERSVDKGMTKIAEGVRSLFTFHGSP